MTATTEARTARVLLVPDGPGARLEVASGLVAPRVVRRSAFTAEVALVATTATLLGGDELRLRVEVGPGLRLDLLDVAGTVAYHGRGHTALVDVSLAVHAGGVLAWAGEPLVVCDGARVTRRLRVQVEQDAVVLLRDRVALGRSGEAGGDLTCHTTMTYADRPALVEDLSLGPGSGPGVLGPGRVLDSVTALGWRPPPLAGDAAYRLHEPGALARQLLVHAHDTTLHAVWAAWSADLSR